MNLIRKRAQHQFPTVLLTLLSIVQAIALESLWAHLQDATYLFELSYSTMLAWTQIVATFFGIVLVWISYASNAMRFRWTPTTADSVYPFLIGVLEFLQIETLGTDSLGQWVILMGIIFGFMVFVMQSTMRRARLSGENGRFFDSRVPATIKDFIPQIMVVAFLLVGGTYIWITGDRGLHSVVLILAVLILLVHQYISTTIFWDNSVQTDAEAEAKAEH